MLIDTLGLLLIIVRDIQWDYRLILKGMATTCSCFEDLCIQTANLFFKTLLLSKSNPKSFLDYCLTRLSSLFLSPALLYLLLSHK